MVKYIKPEDVLSLRSKVLRNNLPKEQCVFPTDHLGFNLGAFAGDQIVSVATFFAEDYLNHERGGWRLRGMATDPDFAGQGFGAELVKFAIDELRSHNASYIWCNARLIAIGFYKKVGFKVISDEFEVPGIGPHFNMLIDL
jgi:ribosomal protein S18 acetylase RimI-like enzyme